MKLQEIKDNKNIVIICGNISSGKGHYAKQYFKDYEHISVSAIVRSLINSSERSKLSQTAYLDSRITEILIEQINAFDKVVVDGIRQPSILQALKDHYGNQIKDIIWLDVPEETLKARFTKRAAGKDDLSFEKALQSDKELGIGDVEAYIRKHGRVIPY